ncbi:hypothetical protein SAMN05216480_102232 [Pustulibacterium marinum]|uniref:Uncharacterized protein n=1 Tax=Pustulibacterium marinum TaxID=1224947 RepID=A0A1I7FTW6_9FLAO|nr:hypothetical protein [Pustulibacterium marinum]SFU39625.1 hypothetical protein SAMN05216480_102232 [Pustulibacterium marinum]
MFKNYLHIFFLLKFSIQLIFGAFTDMKEYVGLYDHYQLHHSEFGDNFYSFLEKHYGKNKASHTKEHDSQHKIPFDNHSGEHHINHFIPNYLLKNTEKITTSVVINHKKTILYTPNCQHWLLSNKLLQPPKYLI